MKRRVPLQPSTLSVLDVEIPTRVGAVTPAVPGAQSGKRCCCPVLCCPKCLPAPMLESTFLWFRVLQTPYARGRSGLNLVLFGVTIPETHSL